MIGGTVLIGYAHVSTVDQNLDLKVDVPRSAGGERIVNPSAIEVATAVTTSFSASVVGISMGRAQA
jgi:hypothetical protein